MSAAGGFPTLRNPPIIEAMLSIHVDALAPENLVRLEALHGALPDYPIVRPAISLRAGERDDAARRDSTVGFEFADGLGHRVFHARLDAFALSFLAPYTRFEELESESRRLWALYHDAFPNASINRIGLRYINRIRIPANDDYSEYLKTVPEVAPSLPQAVEDFALRLVLPDTESSCSAVINEVMDNTSEEVDSGFIFFDIDAFQLVDEFLPESSLWDTVSKLRRFKNRIFFESITDKLLGVYGID